MRSKLVPRCIRCRMLVPSCVCDWMPTFELDTRLVLIMHHRERSKASATAPLLGACLKNSEIRVHGLKDRPVDIGDLERPDRRVLFLFPSSAATVLTTEMLTADPRPVTLVVPDGNWRQASHMRRRLPAIGTAEPVRLAMGRQSSWQLRREVTDERLSTFEAVARALGLIESEAVEAALERFFEIMVAAALKDKASRRMNL